MKVLQISSFDRRGGACIAAFRQHQALVRYGVDSRMWVLCKETGDQRVEAYVPPADLKARLPRIWRRTSLAREASAAKKVGEIFDDRSEYGGDESRNLPDCDVINVQFSQGFIDHPEFYRSLPGDTPVVVTLHEMSCFTGGCSYAGNCTRFHQSCGNCPQLGANGERDYSRRGWQRRRDSYGARPKDKLHFVANSHWTAAQARKSSLLRDFPMSVIHLGVDAEIFRPLERTAAKSTFQIPEGTPVVAFSAASIADERKGMRHLIDSLRALPHRPFLLTWGRSFPTALEEIPHLHLGHIESEHLMAHTYNAADFFVMPSLEEAFGQTCLEAMSCGRPVVGFDVGGIPEMILHGKTGLLVPRGDVAGLATAMQRLIDHPLLGENMGFNARAMVLEQFTFERNAEAYRRLYERLLEP
jgi:glycosyltransferase involved in cell wall biosynthesis